MPAAPWLLLRSPGRCLRAPSVVKGSLDARRGCALAELQRTHRKFPLVAAHLSTCVCLPGVRRRWDTAPCLVAQPSRAALSSRRPAASSFLRPSSSSSSSRAGLCVLWGCFHRSSGCRGLLTHGGPGWRPHQECPRGSLRTDARNHGSREPGCCRPQGAISAACVRTRCRLFLAVVTPSWVGVHGGLGAARPRCTPWPSGWGARLGFRGDV